MVASLAALPLAALTLAGCSSDRAPRPLEPLDDLAAFRDRGGGSCPLKPVAAYGGEFSGHWVGGIAADSDHLYVARYSGDGPLWLTVLDPTDGHEIGRAVVSERASGGSLFRVGDLLLVVLGDRDQTVVVVDVSDPANPEPTGGTVALGRGSPPTAFSAWLQLVFTDGGDLHAIDLSDPTDPQGVRFDGPPFAAPLWVEGELLSAEPWSGLECAVGVWHPQHEGAPPIEGAKVDTLGVCLGAGLAGTAEGALGAGWLDETVVAVGLTRDDFGWSSVGPVRLDVAAPGQVIAMDGGAFVLGDGGVAVRTEGGRPVVAGSWQATPYFWGPAAATGSTVWVAGSAESGAFEGIVGLEVQACR